MNQTPKDIENSYRDVDGYDMSYDEFKQLCRKSWEVENNYPCIDRSEKRDQRRYCIFMKAKTHLLNVFRRRTFFKDDRSGIRLKP